MNWIIFLLQQSAIAISIIMLGSAKLNLLQSMRLCKKICETASDRSCYAMSCRFRTHWVPPSRPSCLSLSYSAVFKSSLPCQHQLVVGARIKLDLLLRILIVSGGTATYLHHTICQCHVCGWLVLWVLFWPLTWLTGEMVIEKRKQ